MAEVGWEMADGRWRMGDGGWEMPARALGDIRISSETFTPIRHLTSDIRHPHPPSPKQ
jgi:hypothetical protein